MRFETNVMVYVWFIIETKQGFRTVSWSYAIPEGATHKPNVQHLNERWYKKIDNKWYRWSSTNPVWDFVSKNKPNNLEAL